MQIGRNSGYIRKLMNQQTATRLKGIDPRARLLAGLLLILGLMILPWGGALWTAAALVPVTLAVIRPSLSRLTTAMFAISWMILLTVLVHGFSTPGHLVWQVPVVDWVLTVEGIQKGLLFAGRLTLIILLGAAISLSIDPLEGIRAGESLLKPLSKIGIPIGSIALIFGLTLRFIPTLFDEAKTLRNALLARGWSPGKGVVARVRAWIPLFIPLLASGLRRSDDIAETLVMRGFLPQGTRSTGRVLSWGKTETLLLAVAILPFLMLLVRLP